MSDSGEIEPLPSGWAKGVMWAFADIPDEKIFARVASKTGVAIL